MKQSKLPVALFCLALALTLSWSSVRASNQPPRSVHPLLKIEPVNTFVVTKTGDAGISSNGASGTLRWAMNQANASAGYDLIRFDLPGSGTQTITIKDWLPDLTDNAGVMIDGTQSDDRIVLDASQQNMYHYAIAVYSDNNVIKGLTVKNATGNGIGIDKNAGYNLIIGNTITGAWEGVRIAPGSHHNTIGGTNGVTPGGACTGDCNLLSGNRAHGLVIDHADNNLVIGNFVGLNAAGTAAQPNIQDGIIIANGSGNLVGGTTPQERNVISGNTLINIEVGENDRSTRSNTIRGNYIGPISSGNSSPGGKTVGVELHTNSSGTILEDNVISGNGGTGVLIFLGSNGNRLSSNYIGVAANGTSALPNRGIAIIIQTGNNVIEDNIIANHPSDAIRVKSGTNNAIRRNSIYGNTKLGINLAVDGYTPNDSLDPDTGPNTLQNFPILSSANALGGIMGIQGSLNSRPNAQFTIELFQNSTCNNTYNHQEGQGKNYLGSTTVTTNSSGNASFNVSFETGLGSGIVTATATDASGNTSEFSSCINISNAEPVPPAPAILTPENGSTLTTTQPHLDWSDSGAHHYVVLIRQDSKTGPKAHLNKNVRAMPYDSPALAEGHTFFWRVKACNSLNKCSKTAWYTFNVP